MNTRTISPLARADLLQHEAAAAERFGNLQAARLIDAFQEAVETLTDNPMIGHLREDLSPPGQSLRYWSVKRRFLIVYRPRKNGVEIARVFDGAQDVRAILGRATDD